LVRLVFLAVAALTLLTACGQGLVSGPSAFGGTSPLRSRTPVARTAAHFVQLRVHPDRRPSYMQPDAGKKSALIYGSDDATNDVFVFDYKSGKQVGTLTGFSAPYGMCVDAKGDIYITNFSAGSVVEYAHGGSTVLNTYSSVGEPIGCSVDANDDVAITSFSPGEVVVFDGGDPSKSTTYAGACTYQWPMGYDDKNNLIGVGEESTGSIVACALLAGSKSMTTLSGCCTGPITIDFPGGTMWDGQYIALGDQEAGGTFLTGVWPSTLSGTTLSSNGEVKFETSCFGDYVDDVNPFIIGKHNTPVNRKQGKIEIGPNPCTGTLRHGEWIALFHYPAGGSPFKLYGGNGPAEPYGMAVSLKT
jgi:hypothetical protein